MAVIYKFDGKKDKNTDWELVRASIAINIYENKPLTLIQFTCSTINPSYMFNLKQPEKYVSLNPEGNNMEVDLPTTNKLYFEIAKIIPVRLIILIGNTDPFYIYSQEGTIYPNIPTEALLKRFNKRWRKYKKNLECYLQLKYPTLKVEVVSWYELEQKMGKLGWDFRLQFQKTKENISKYFRKEDFKWELNRLSDQFGSGKYFYNLDRPSTLILGKWIKRKFAEYTTQGFWIKLIFPGCILLQNEKPSDLRTSMYQPLIREVLNTKLPVIYPYGVDNLGFQ